MSYSLSPDMGMPIMRSSSHINSIQKDLLSLPTLPSISSSMGKRKRPTKPITKANKVVKKTVSTPTLKRTIDDLDDDLDELDSDKKRNKLGYHRTSVACGKSISASWTHVSYSFFIGHCRRRKIRCMMPDEDPSGRCSNCIRLKKECNFYPVEQSLQGKGSNGRANSVPKHSASSPNSHMYMSGYNQNGYPHMTSFSVPPEPHNGLGIYPSGPPSDSGASYPPPYEQQPHWENSYAQQLPPMTAAPHETMYQSRPYDSPVSMTPPSQPYGRPPPSYLPGQFEPAKNEISWIQQPTPSRSVSYADQHASPTNVLRYSHSPIPDVSRHASQAPSLISGDMSSTSSLSESIPVGSMSAPLSNYGWQTLNPWTPLSAGADPYIPAVTVDGKSTDGYPFDSAWFPDAINGY